MTLKAISSELIKNLIKKDDLKLPKTASIFTPDEHNIFRTAIKNQDKVLWMREKWFVIRYSTRKGEPWVTVRPQKGFVPMFQIPVKKALDRETEI